MAGVAGAADHSKVAANLPGEQHAVAVIGQKGVFQLMEGLEVLGPANANGGAVVAVAPGDVVFAVNQAHPGVIAVLLADHVLLPLKDNGIMVNVPVNAVLRETGENVHLHPPVVAAENPGVSVAKGHHSRVENAVGGGNRVPLDNGVLVITPNGLVAACGLVLPGHVGRGGPADNFCHNKLSFCFYKHDK